MAGAKKVAPTINDVAAAAGVSRATASRALANYGRVSPDTVERVRKAADEMGYRPNGVARSMRAGKTKTIGLVIIADFTHAFFARATKAIVDAAKIEGFQVLISNTDEDIAAERQAVLTLVDKQVDGLIVVPSSGAEHDHLSARHLGGRPVVLVDRRFADGRLTSVTTDDFAGADAAVRHAYSLGHERFGFLITAGSMTGFTDQSPEGLISTTRERINGFLNGASACGIKPKSQQWLFCGGTPSDAEPAVSKMLNNSKPPTIIFAANNDVALGVLKVAGDRQLMIGRDLSLITFDDSPWAAAMTPGLTVVARPVEELGAIAVAKLIAEIGDPSQSGEKVILATELIVRGSVANLKTSNGGTEPH